MRQLPLINLAPFHRRMGTPARRYLCPLLVCLLIVSCSSKSYASDPESTAAVKVISDLPYLGADRFAKLDLYLPPEPAEADTKLRPGIIIIHGGGWIGGTKSARREKNIGNTLANAGYVCASIDYELGKKSNKVADCLRSIWPRNLVDCKSAVRYLRANAEKYRIDKDHIGVIGGSAGGHLAAMLAVTDSADGFDNAGYYHDQSSQIQAAVPMYGIHDVYTLARNRGNSLDDADTRILINASPVTYIDEDDPPMLILHGTKDLLISVRQSRILHRCLLAKNVSSKLMVIKDAPHSFHLQPKQQDLRPDVIAFFDRWLKPGQQDEL